MNEREEGRITDQLRVCARTFLGVWVDGDRQTITFTTSDVPPTADSIRMDSRLLAIADSIDAEHEEALREAYTKGREDGMGMANAKDAHAEYLRGRNDGYDDGWDAGFASADDWCAQHENAMNEHGWVKLPKDADGEYIHIGDRMENNERVARIVLTDGSWEPSVYLSKLPNFLNEHFCHEISHYHAPTVEDVLREFVLRVAGKECMTARPDVITEYAAKLRLADDGREQ